METVGTSASVTVFYVCTSSRILTWIGVARFNVFTVCSVKTSFTNTNVTIFGVHARICTTGLTRISKTGIYEFTIIPVVVSWATASVAVSV